MIFLIYLFVNIINIFGSTINNIPEELSSIANNNFSNRTVTVFQAVDNSFLPLWLNWWALALEFNAFPENWKLHLACFGESNLDVIIKKFHKPGCSQLTSKHYKKRIYFAKWSAATKAFEEGNDLLIIDLDAVLIRDPRRILYFDDSQNSLYDVISSRDHGPDELPYSNNWSIWRFCTGFIFIKYSQKTLELVHAALRRCDKYGHDQIQFNNVLSRNSLIWNNTKENMIIDRQDQTALLPWTHQTHPDYILINESADHNVYTNRSLHIQVINDLINRPKGEKLKINTFKDKYNISLGRSETVINSIDVIKIVLLKRFSVLRYCNEKQRNYNDFNLKKYEYSYEEGQSIIALHCFVGAISTGEQGNKKKQVKHEVMQKLDFWILKNEWSIDLKSIHNYKPISSSTDGLINKIDDINTRHLLNEMVDRDLLNKARSEWIIGRKEGKSYFETL